MKGGWRIGALCVLCLAASPVATAGAQTIEWRAEEGCLDETRLDAAVRARTGSTASELALNGRVSDLPSNVILIVPRMVLPAVPLGTENTQTALPPTNRAEFGRTVRAPAFAVQVTRPLRIGAPVSLRVAAMRTVNVPPALGDAGAVFSDLNTTRAGAIFTS